MLGSSVNSQGFMKILQFLSQTTSQRPFWLLFLVVLRRAGWSQSHLSMNFRKTNAHRQNIQDTASPGTGSTINGGHLDLLMYNYLISTNRFYFCLRCLCCGSVFAAFFSGFGWDHPIESSIISCYDSYGPAGCFHLLAFNLRTPSNL